MSSTIDKFILRRMQSAASNRWQSQAEKKPARAQLQEPHDPEPGPAEDLDVEHMLSHLDATVVQQLQDSISKLRLDEAQEDQEEAEVCVSVGRSSSSREPDLEPEPQQPRAQAQGPGRPHVGPRQWHQRPVFHDVLDCDLLDDDDEDFFGTSSKNKTLRSSKNSRGESNSSRPKRSRARPQARTLKMTMNTPRAARSLSPTPPARRNKVMCIAA